MGWLYQMHTVPDVKKHFRTEVFRTSTPGYAYEVVDDAIASGRGEGSVYYAAVRLITPNAPPQMFLAVCLFHNRMVRGMGFGYKDMTEDMGPCEVNCPERLLKLVPEPTSGYAVEWRAQVRAYWAQKRETAKAAKGFEPGTFIRLPRALRFRGGWEADCFQVAERKRSRLVRTESGYSTKDVRQTYYHAATGYACRFPKALLAGAVAITVEEFRAARDKVPA